MSDRQLLYGSKGLTDEADALLEELIDWVTERLAQGNRPVAVHAACYAATAWAANAKAPEKH